MENLVSVSLAAPTPPSCPPTPCSSPIPTGVGVDIHVKILENFAAHVAPSLGWQPNREGPVIGYPID